MCPQGPVAGWGRGSWLLSWHTRAHAWMCSVLLHQTCVGVLVHASACVGARGTRQPQLDSGGPAQE